MTKDIYEIEKTKRNTEKNLKIIEQDDSLNKLEKTEIVKSFKQKLSELSEIIERVDEIQKVEITNLPEVEKTEFPDIQKVEITNPQTFPELKIPELQKVEVTNPQQIPEFPENITIENVSELAIEIAKRIVIPRLIKAEVTNPTLFDVPVGEGNNPRKTSPTRYVPVRLTNGDRFYNALEDAYVAAAKAVFPFVNKTTGKPQAATVDDNGTLNVDVVIDNINLTVSGTLGAPLFGQVKVTVSGTRVQFPANMLKNGVAVVASPTNTAPLVIGDATVNYQLDGTGNGVQLSPGSTAYFAIDNTNRLYLNGNTTDWVSFQGS